MIAKLIAEALRRLAQRISPADNQSDMGRLLASTKRIEEMLNPAMADLLIRMDRKLERGLYDLAFVKQRSGTYLGDGVALTYLADETPIFTNSNDYGPPMNFLIGGRYEPENHDLLMSFLKPDSVVLDIGANAGFYTLSFARRLRHPGRVIAFEPHPLLAELVRRSVHINGLHDVVEIHQCGLSDSARTENFHYPAGHLGGGHVGAATADGGTTLTARLARLDDILPDGTAVDIAKIDVEGHELPALAGMVRTIRQSPDLVILMEKLSAEEGREAAILDFLASVGMAAYAVENGELNGPVSLQDFRDLHGHFIAARPGTAAPLQRRFFALYPQQMFWPRPPENLAVATASGPEGELLFHGPYWLLPKGVWTVQIEGRIEGQITLALNENFGHVVAEAVLDAQTCQHRFTVDHDLSHFECVARVKGPFASVTLERLVLTRTG